LGPSPSRREEVNLISIVDFMVGLVLVFALLGILWLVYEWVFKEDSK